MESMINKTYNDKVWKHKILLKLLRKKSFRKRFMQSEFVYQQIVSASGVLQKPLSKLVYPQQLVLENYISRNGNVSPYELMVISALALEKTPKRLLEIGTFDGNTTLQLALNTPEEAVIHTIDLPPNEEETQEPILKGDLTFIRDKAKHKRKFEDSRVSYKIKQHLGDSTNYDFARFSEEGPLDFIFIDGGHSIECVASDTENALKVLSEKGTILWHDFTPHFPGVFQFLSGLAKKLPLIHISQTNLVMLAR